MINPFNDGFQIELNFGDYGVEKLSREDFRECLLVLFVILSILVFSSVVLLQALLGYSTLSLANMLLHFTALWFSYRLITFSIIAYMFVMSGKAKNKVLVIKSTYFQIFQGPLLVGLGILAYLYYII